MEICKRIGGLEINLYTYKRYGVEVQYKDPNCSNELLAWDKKTKTFLTKRHAVAFAKKVVAEFLEKSVKDFYIDVYDGVTHEGLYCVCYENGKEVDDDSEED